MKYLILLLMLTGCADIPLNMPTEGKTIVIHVIVNDNIGYGSRGAKIMGTHTINNGIHYLQLPTIRWLDDYEMWCVWGHELGHAVLIPREFHNKFNGNTCFKK